MTEVDIMHDLDCCSKGDCNRCSRYNGSDQECDRLMKDTYSIIKAQKEALEMAADASNRQQEEMALFRDTVANGYTKSDLMERVNVIIEEAHKLGAGWHDDENYVWHDPGENFGGVVGAMKHFLKLVDKEATWEIVVHREDSYPMFKRCFEGK